MTTTVTTESGQRHVPLGAAAAVAAVILGAGALGFAWTQAQDSPTQAPVEQHFPTNQDYLRYWDHFAGTPKGAGENANVAEHSLPGGNANATVADPAGRPAGSSGGGASFRHPHPSIRHFHN
jgi:hypothetical protein